MRVLVYTPEATSGEEREIDGSLESLQAIVGGYIEMVRLTPALGLVVNEEGQLIGLPPNRSCASWGIVGPVFVTRISGPEFESLTDDDIAFVRFTLDTVRTT